MKTAPTLTVNFHGQEGRGFFQLDLTAFSVAERQFILRICDHAVKGVSLDIGVADDGRYCMKFFVGAQRVEVVDAKV